MNRTGTLFKKRYAILAAAPLTLSLWTLMPHRVTQAAEEKGVIHGTVTADAGKVIAFQVKIRDTERKITYTVFTNSGRYRVPNLPAGNYEIWVSQERFQSTTQRATLNGGETRQVDLSIQSQPLKSDIEIVDYDLLYPPGPGRAAAENRCMSCHGITFHQRGKTREEWKQALDAMNVPGEGQFKIPVYTTLPEADLVLDYLSKNFGPDAPKRQLKLDTMVLDEKELGDAIYIEYDLPPPAVGTRRLHDPYVGPDGSVWWGDTGARSVFRLDPKASFANRIPQEFRSPHPGAGVHGHTVDSQGRVYYADIRTGMLGEVDPKIGEFKMYETMPDSSMLQVVVDSQDNVWFNLALGNKIGKLDAKTRKIAMWELPTPDSNLYGLVVDHEDKIWSAAIAQHFIVKFDPVTEKFTEYKTPVQPSGPRRLGVDRDGNIWWAEYIGGHVGKLNPKTGEMKEYKIPLRLSSGYECWPVGDDVWLTDFNYHAFIRFNRTSEGFTFYPLPQKQGGPGVPKIEVGHDGTIWFGFRGLKNNTAVAFRPRGARELR
ncbi:MAG: carboxypeptidase regulatory-like domain-containing protein [Acidobacteria bacterium]|nr:carboxypeptidase regulatory-like domain-containing protein [Acidobacteriota bacterium]